MLMKLRDIQTKMILHLVSLHPFGVTTSELWKVISPLYKSVDEFVTHLSGMSHASIIRIHGDKVYIAEDK